MNDPVYLVKYRNSTGADWNHEIVTSGLESARRFADEIEHIYSHLPTYQIELARVTDTETIEIYSI